MEKAFDTVSATSPREASS